eukprot:3752075-Heterocapsa_arctica.AAC.1
MGPGRHRAATREAPLTQAVDSEVPHSHGTRHLGRHQAQLFGPGKKVRPCSHSPWRCVPPMGNSHMGELPQVQGHAGMFGRGSHPSDRSKAPLEKGLGPCHC